MQKEILKDIKTLVTAIILALGVFTVSAWNGPISAPPQGNAYAPINTTATSQTKQGSIWASGFFTTGGGYFGDNVGIGTASPEARLDVRSGSCYYKLQADGFYTNCSTNTPDPAVYLTISSDTANYNIATALGNPASAKNVVLTINSGVKVYSNSTSQPALDTGTLPSGSTVTIVNNGTIVGKGGAGGNGYGIGGCCGTPGENGGNSINASANLTIDNTNGYIFAGGGGGGGGGSQACPKSSWDGGGGGGGGAGYTAGVGGSGGSAHPGDNGPCGFEGNSGETGSLTTGGSGGAGRGVGGQGGANGAPGTAGGSASLAGQSGGSAGKAVNLNGNSIAWTGGNNDTQVKGAVQ